MAGRATLRRVLAALGCRRGIAALEFGIIAPVFILGLAGGVDVGNAILGRYRLDAAINAAANYALVNAGQVEATDAQTLASNLAKIVANTNGTNWATSSVTVNNGPTAAVATQGNSSGGSVANIAACYCPTGNATSVTWGASATCGSVCTGGGTAGQFTVISGTYIFTPLFSSYHFIGNNGHITVTAMVQTK